MSKVPYVIDVDRFICSELEMIRDMLKTHDFSALPAVVERIQFHASSMEDALWDRKGKLSTIESTLEKDDLTDTKKLKKISKTLKGK